MENMEGFGKAKYGGSGGFKIYDLKTDNQGGSVSYVFRLLPPMKSQASTGVWAIYYGQHFGYAGVDPKDANKTKQRPFKCIEEKNFRTGMITRACPECALVATRKADLEFKEAQAKADTSKTEEMINDLLAEDRDWLKSHNCQRQWYMNVMTPSNEFGILRMSHEVKKLLEAKIKEAKETWGVDPTDLETGCWFRFTRTGRKISVTTTVDLEMVTNRDGSGRAIGQSLKQAPLTREQAVQALQECPDLTEVVRVLSEEQISLLTQSGGDPEEVDRIWAMGQRDAEQSPRPVSRPVPRPAPAPAPAAAPKPAPQPAPAAAPVAPPAEDPKIAALRALGFNDAQIAALSAMAPTPAAAPAPQPMAPPAPEPQQAAAPQPPAPVPPKPASTPASVGLPRDQFMELFKKN